jgi:hypothetical protein
MLGSAAAGAVSMRATAMLTQHNMQQNLGKF